MGAKYLSARILDDGTALELYVTLNKLPSELESPSDLYWDGHRARWEDVRDAGKYEVSLYREDHHVKTITTTSTSHSFSSELDRTGDYYFRVRAIMYHGDQKGAWSDDSDNCYIDKNDSNRGSGYNDNHNSDCPSYTSGNSTGWHQDNRGWWFSNPDGSYVNNNWLQLNGVWYYLKSNGYMCTGWVEVQGKWYYMNAQGAMLSNTTTPDGYYVDASGVWIQNNAPSASVGPSAGLGAVANQVTHHVSPTIVAGGHGNSN